MKRRSVWIAATLATLLLADPGMVIDWQGGAALAKSSSSKSWGRSLFSSSKSSSSSSGYKSSSSSSSSSSGSSGYSKSSTSLSPSSSSSSSSSGSSGYSKSSTSPSSSSSSSSSSSGSSGYGKSSTSLNSASSSSSSSSSSSGSSGYSKPLASSASSATATGSTGSVSVTSGGYTKSATVGTTTAPKGSSTDQTISRQLAAGSLSGSSSSSLGSTPTSSGGSSSSGGVTVLKSPQKVSRLGSSTTTTTTTTTSSGSSLLSTPSRSAMIVGAGAAVAGVAAAGVAAAATPPPQIEIDRPALLAELDKQQRELSATRNQEIATARATGLYQALTGGKSFTREEIAAARKSYYSNHTRYPKRYHGFGLFDRERFHGVFDPGFLLTMLYPNSQKGQTKETALFWYALLDEPGVSKFLDEAATLAKATADQELTARISQVEQQLKTMIAKKAPHPTPEQLLKEYPPLVVVRDEVAMGKPEVAPLRFATGQPQGAYHAFCQGAPTLLGLKERAGPLAVECAKSAGSAQNLAAFESGTADAILAQSDVVAGWLRENSKRKLGAYQVSVTPELFWLLVNRESGITALADLDPRRHTLQVGPQGSGSAASWKSLIQQAKGDGWLEGERLGGLPTRDADHLEAARLVAGDPNQALLLVTGSDSGLIRKIAEQHGSQLRIIPFMEGAFKWGRDREGNLIYGECPLPTGRYPQLQLAGGKADTSTLCVEMVAALSEAWVEKYGEANENDFLRAAGATNEDFHRLQEVE